MRKALYSLLVDLNKYHRTNKALGLYPPKINTSKEQTNEEMLDELRKIINYMKNPYFSYLRKDK